MTNKLDELKVSIQSTNASIILITETWLTRQIPDSLIHQPGYAKTEEPGGGICPFVKSDIAGHNVHATISQTYNTIEPVESIWLEILIGKIKILVACVYRPKEKNHGSTKHATHKNH